MPGAGDAIGGRLGISFLTIGDFQLLTASPLSWVGIAFVAVVATLGPQARNPMSDRNGILGRSVAATESAGAARDGDVEDRIASRESGRSRGAVDGESAGSRRFLGGLALGALVGAAIAGSTIWQRHRRRR